MGYVASGRTRGSGGPELAACQVVAQRSRYRALTSQGDTWKGDSSACPPPLLPPLPLTPESGLGNGEGGVLPEPTLPSKAMSKSLAFSGEGRE